MLNKIRKNIKLILIIEIVIVYLFTLCVIIVKHRNDDVDTSGFENILFKGESYATGVTVSGDSIFFDGQTDTIREYSEVIDLTDVTAIDISFSYEYPADTRDTGISIDLYEPESGYDRDSQQFVTTLTAGTGTSGNRIILDSDHPDRAFIRFIYVDNDVNFSISDVRACVIRSGTDDIVFVLYMIDGVLIALVAATALYWYISKNKGTEAKSDAGAVISRTAPASEKKINYQFKVLYAIGMFLVVATHCANGSGVSFFKELFPAYGFHVGMFVFCSGYFYKEKAEENILGYIWKKIKSLLIPMYMYNFAYALIAQLLSLFGFTIGAGVTLEKLLLLPIYDGHQFAFNLASWFIFPLFMAEVFNVLYRKCLSIFGKKVREFIYIIGALALGTFGLWMSARGYNTGWWLALTRFLHFIPFYCAGYFYNKVLEKRDTLPNVPYFAIVIGAQLGCMLIFGDTLTFSQAWCIFHGSMVWPYIIGFLGIAFWLRIARVIEPVAGKSKLVNLVADNTVAIMNNHLLGFWLVNSIFAIFYLNTETMFRGFDLKKYLSDVYYYYLPRGLTQTTVIYIAVAFALSLLIAVTVKKCKTKLYALNPKRMPIIVGAVFTAVTIGSSFLISYYVSHSDNGALLSYTRYSWGTELSFTKADNSAENYCVYGFSGAEDQFTWTDGNESAMEFTLPETSADLRLDITCGTYRGQQNVELYANDDLVCKELFEGDLGEYQIVIPNEYLDDDTLMLKLVLPDASSPAQDSGSGDTRVLGLSMHSIALSES